MNLSKDDLSFALVCAKGYFYDSLNSDYPNKDDQKNAELFRDLEQAANNDTLEIEGYSRNEWVKFDPKNPKTFPPKNSVVLVMICKKLSDGAPKKMSVEVFNEYHMPNWLGGTFTHWRPLPPPPGKEAKCG